MQPTFGHWLTRDSSKKSGQYAEHNIFFQYVNKKYFLHLGSLIGNHFFRT